MSYLLNFQSILYKEILPQYGIKKVHFRCDGAGCFVGNEVKGNFCAWNEYRTGSVVEMTYKNNVPGKGKTSLDGLFGILTQHINRLIDEKHSFDSAETLYKILTDNPIEHTEFHLLNLNRKLTDDWKVPKFVEKYQLGRSYYFMLRTSDDKAKVFCHSRHGKGKVLSFAKHGKKLIIFINSSFFETTYITSYFAR